MAGSPTTDARLWRLVRDERQDILAFLRGLDAGAWNAPSLCAGWRVRDVAAHLLVDAPVHELGWLGVVTQMARQRFSVHRANDWWVRHNANAPLDSLVARLEDSLEPGPISRLLGAGSQIRASVIHHQDMRRAIGPARTVPAERLRAVLDVVLTTKGSINLGSKPRASGLRLTATDLDWSHGDGPEVCGPAEALVMSLAGRSVALAELDGPGLKVLADRAASVG